MNSFFEDSPKCMLYRYVFDPNMLQFCLDHAVNYIYKPFICKYRISAHCLNIETGRFYNIERHHRLCNMCDKQEVEDEYHFILECDKYNDIKCKYLKSYYYERPSTFKLVQLLSVRNVKELNNLGKYLFANNYFINS